MFDEAGPVSPALVFWGRRHCVFQSCWLRVAWGRLRVQQRVSKLLEPACKWFISYKQARLCQCGFWSSSWTMASNSGSEVPERTLHLRLVLLMRKKWFPSFSVMLFTYVSGGLKWNVALEGAISLDVIKPLRSCWSMLVETNTFSFLTPYSLPSLLSISFSPSVFLSL